MDARFRGHDDEKASRSIQEERALEDGASDEKADQTKKHKDD
jgi:hypothetical protein